MTPETQALQAPDQAIHLGQYRVSMKRQASHHHTEHQELTAQSLQDAAIQYMKQLPGWTINTSPTAHSGDRHAIYQASHQESRQESGKRALINVRFLNAQWED